MVIADNNNNMQANDDNGNDNNEIIDEAIVTDIDSIESDEIRMNLNENENNNNDSNRADVENLNVNCSENDNKNQEILEKEDEFTMEEHRTMNAIKDKLTKEWMLCNEWIGNLTSSNTNELYARKFIEMGYQSVEMIENDIVFLAVSWSPVGLHRIPPEGSTIKNP